ncbi:MAG TPA: MobF family relaxase, partial [Acidimicrobiales bacterium]
MRFTITRLGGAGRSVDRIVAAIVDYLRPRNEQEPQDAGVGGRARYYTDGGEEPGRWRGRGAAAAGLAGDVDMADFAQVLAGRDPRTGERLVTARGSAGRRPRLGVGQRTRNGPDGEALYDTEDVAAALSLPASQVKDMLRAGEVVALSRMFGVPFPPQPPWSYLTPFVDTEGGRWVTDQELARCRDALAAGPAPAQIEASGGSGDVIGLAEAARLTGITHRYLRRLAQRHEARTTRPDPARRTRLAVLPAQRGAGGRWLVRRQDLADFVRTRRPPAVRVAFDLTLTTEKSLGVLALLSPPATRQQVLGAIEAGNDLGVDWLEGNAAAVREGDEVVPVGGWTVASFRHLTSRRLDPFPHHHNVVANTAAGTDGKRRALDARGLYTHAKAASALATAEMRYRLTEALGVQWRPGSSGGWEVAGIPDEVLHEFSQRRNEIEDALREIEEAIGHGTSLEDVDRTALRTRPDKRHVDVADLVAEWWDRARTLGFDPAALRARTGHGPALPEPDAETIHAALAARDGVCANVSIFNRGDLLTTLVNLPMPVASGDDRQPLVVPARRLEEIADGFLASDQVLLLEPADQHRPALYTTSEALAVQDRIVDRYRTGLDAQAGIVPRPAVDAALAWHPQLTRQQRALVRAFCGSGHRVQCAVGHPGAGKTTAMAAAARAWETAGWRVLGAAVKGEAARTLGVAAGIPSETLAWYLAHPDPPTAPLDARTVLIVDEASTISDRDLDHLGWLADQTGAVLRLIGDPAQHGAVEAGGMYRVLCEQHPDNTPVLTDSHRLQHPEDRAAADHLRAGDVAAALDALDRAGHLHVVDDELHAYTDVLARWWTAHLLGHDHPMVNRRNSVRRALNRLAHTLLQANGEIGTDQITAAGDRRYAVGDRVIARRPDRNLYPTGEPAAYVRNGAIGTVVSVHRDPRRADDVLLVQFDHLGQIALPRSFFDEPTPAAGTPVAGRDVGLDHAYALTSYAVTGATHPVSTSRIDEGATR